MPKIRANMSLSITTPKVPDLKPRPARKAAARTDLQTRQIDPRIMKEALRLADGEPSRIEFHEDGTVTVHNAPYRR